jgi:hypothetical protein
MADTCYECGTLYVSSHQCPVILAQIKLREDAIKKIQKANPESKEPVVRDAIRHLQTEVKELDGRLEDLK